ncbi:40S ribosomal protein S13 [Glycine soja]|uniref:40S ribosomal protein S13 n=1 Tax=Glycine soja TaxID=3848 RepID=A0A0B2R0W7_GLYSO|nr:40S ribosomal protein S13 [Glycine soja]
MITTGFIKNPSLAAKLVLSFISSPHEPLVEFARYVFYMHHAFHDFCNDPFFWNPLIRSHSHGENICKFAKKGLTPSHIGVILHDSHGIAQVKSVTGSKILRILKAHRLAPEISKDLYHLIKKVVYIRKHLERNKKDKDSKFKLILVESRIHRLAHYYKKTKKLPPVWK